MMRKLGLAFLACLLVAGAALAAEGEAEKKDTRPSTHHGWGVRAGYLSAEDDVAKVLVGKPNDFLTENPSLASGPVIGGFYYVETKSWMRVEGAIDYIRTDVEHVCPDVNVSAETPEARSCVANEASVSTNIYHFNVRLIPHIKLNKTGEWGMGFPFGLGWALARANKPYAPSSEITSRSGDIVLEDSGGMTYFYGVRPFWNLAPRKSIFLDVRVLRFHRLVNIYAATTHTYEIAAGMNFELSGKKKEKKKKGEAAPEAGTPPPAPAPAPGTPPPAPPPETPK